jgi:dUTP pyrophosphatase
MDPFLQFLNPLSAILPPIVKFKKVHPDAVIPEYKTAGAAGMDLTLVHDENERFITLHTHVPMKVSTGLLVEIPEGYEGQVRPRSGLALKKGIAVLNSPGTIDSDYRGPLDVILINNSRYVEYLDRGERIAQLVIAPVARAVVQEVAELSSTDRGDKGFGSTGK